VLRLWEKKNPVSTMRYCERLESYVLYSVL
jgi:hypothetical protein